MENAKQYWNSRYTSESVSTVNLDEYSLIVKDLLLRCKSIINDLSMENSKILDIGGGTGKNMKFFDLNSHNNQLYLIDISSEALKIAKNSNCCTDAVACDIEKENVRFEDKYFDFILVQEIIEHLNNYKQLFAESYRLLKKGGYLLVTTPNIAGLIDRIFLLRGKSPLAMQWDESHIKFFTFKQLENEIIKNGFEVVTSTTQGVYFAVRNRFFKIPLLPLINKNLGQHIIILARK